MSNQEKVFQVLEATGLNWTVNKKELVSVDGLNTESFGMFRNDNNQWLGTVGKRYEPYQNHKLVSNMVDITSAVDLDVTRGGVLAKGKKVFLQAKLPDDVVGNSGIKRWLTTTNSHDGTSAITLGYSNMVIACSNSFHAASKGSNRFRHTINADSNIQDNVKQIQFTLANEMQLIETFKAMQATTIKDEAVDRTVRSLFGIGLDTMQDDISTRKRNQVETFSNNLVTEINTHGKTMWSLFNAVTRYTNHEIAPQEEDAKNNFLMNGGGFKMSNLGYAEVMKFVDANTDGILI
jgi:phage/plasmid-like protein (TIGR03299 family)